MPYHIQYITHNRQRRRQWRRSSCTRTVDSCAFGNQFIVTNILFGFCWILFPFVKSTAHALLWYRNSSRQVCDADRCVCLRLQETPSVNRNRTRTDQTNGERIKNNLRNESQFHGYVQVHSFSILYILLFIVCPMCSLTLAIAIQFVYLVWWFVGLH